MEIDLGRRALDFGATLDAQLSPSGRQTYRRSALIDSCGSLHVASGKGFSSPNQVFDSPGLETRTAGGSWSDDGIFGGAADLDFPEAHTLMRARSNSSTDFFWFIAPGQGIFSQASGCNPPGGGGCENGCETEGPGHSPGDGSARRAREEGQPPAIGRRVFSVQEAREMVQRGALELYDVSGRRAVELRAGLFFSIERNKAGVVTARHLVLVRR